LGWARVLWFRIGRDVFLGGKASDERSFTHMRQRRRPGGVDHERGRVGYRFAARGRLPTAAERSV
jgi:hypothetical protein